MKAFNKNKANKHIKIKQNKDTYIKKLSISLSCLILLICAILLTFAKFENSSDTYTMISGQLDEYSVCPYSAGKVWNFSYTGSAQEFKVPCSGDYKIELWGAQGGYYDSTTPGALGGYTAGNIDLDKDLSIYVYVGNRMDQYTTELRNIKVFNNGTSSSNGYNGGGATDVRLVNGNWDYFNSLKSRIMVAGGGGITNQTTGNAGPGGGLKGYDSTNASGTKGGTQTTFGTSSYLASSFGIANGGCTGGGGYYPGGGATCANGSGGGSSFISGYSGCNAISASSTESNVVHTNQPNHYSGKVFKNGVMIDGKGCNWSSGSAANCGTNQPQPSGSNAVGHSGTGYARITLVSRQRIEKKINDKCLYDVGQEWNFDYTGNSQDLLILCNGNYKIEVWGANGGDAKTDTGNTFTGGRGAYTKGNINLTRKLDLIVQVGGAGTDSVWNKNLGTIEGGYNGGGPTLGQYEENSRCWGTGGGATDIRLVGGVIDSFDSLKSRIMVAAGGGGAFAQGASIGDNGGSAGGLKGYDGSNTGYSTSNRYGYSYGASQTSPGYMTNYTGANSNYDASLKYYAKFGYATKVMSNCSAGGGGGYYGGANSGHVNSASAGSSFISGYSGCNAISGSSTESNIVHTNQTSHYSGKTFTSGVMIDGKGCTWASGSAASCGANQTQPYGSATAGRTGNGYARITLVTKN